MTTGTIRYTIVQMIHASAAVLDDRPALERRMAAELAAKAAEDGWDIPEGRLTSFRLDWQPEGYPDLVRVVAETVVHHDEKAARR